MAVANKILVRRYRVYDPLEQDVFVYSGGELNFFASGDKSLNVAGWLVDWEKILRGPKRIIFFEDDGFKFIDVGGLVFKIEHGVEVHCVRNIFISKLSVINNGVPAASVTYLTPWWRLIFDDGSHPDLQFPLEYFSKLWVDNIFIFNKVG
ncbi:MULTISPECIES: hypothetical protein [Xanthomonas]|uniref:hypothetical protein n=1 Tax=Xanthomonas TaxID=338 RepID=UPI00123E0DB0|nr:MULTISPECIES: hypothetical protein [Xanthomonas]